MTAPTTRSTAITEINRELREDGTHYTFDDLRSKFRNAYYESIADDDSYVTIKIPSASEYAVPTSWVALALNIKRTR